MRISCSSEDKMREAPNKPIPIAILCRSIWLATTVIESTTILRNQGLAITRALLAKIKRNDFASSTFMSESNMRLNR
jgi:hypothetical protein